MKKQRKYLFTAVLFSLLIASCEKDMDNTIPGNPKERIKALCQNFNHIFTANTEKGKIWISDALQCPRLLYFEEHISLPFFIALSPKKENNIHIYATILYDTIQKDSPKDEFGLLINPNQYSIQGTPSLSFSISKQSVLSSLSITGLSDFDFDVYQYNQDAIHLKAIHQVAQNKEVIFRPYDFNDNTKAFFGACQNLFYNSQYAKTSKDYYFFSSWKYKHISLFIKDSKNTILHEVHEDELYDSGFITFLPSCIEPFYNKEKKVFAFKVKYYKDDDGEYQVKTFYRYHIQYLIPISATEHEMVFSGLGKKLDSEGKATEEDETYTISFSIID